MHLCRHWQEFCYLFQNSVTYVAAWAKEKRIHRKTLKGPLQDDGYFFFSKVLICLSSYYYLDN